MSKTRTDAWETNLPEEVRWELYALTKAPSEEEREAGRAWLRDYRNDVLPYLASRGLAAPSRSAWYRFLGRMREEEAARTVIRVETARRIAQGIERADIDPALAANALTALSVDAAADGNLKVSTVLAGAAAKFHAAAQGAERLRLEAMRQRTAEEQLRLAREKFEAAEKRLAQMAEVADAARGGKVDPEKVADEIDRILGRKK